jgi:hypothetical protein
VSFGGLVLTQNGINLQGKVQGGKTLQFTRVGIGSGELIGPIANVSAMINEIKSLSIYKLNIATGGKVTLGVVLSNQEIASGFWWKEIGIYAKDPDTQQELLYAYGNAQSAAEYIPAGTNSADVIEKNVDVVLVVGTGGAITASIDKSHVYETVEDAEQKINDAVSIVQNNLNNHVTNKNNPHNVTKAQVGLGNADNTKDMDKPVSTAQAAAIADHTNNKNNPHNVTKFQIGLGNVDNTKDADKPVSTAQQTALDKKANKDVAQMSKITNDDGNGNAVFDLNTVSGTKTFEAVDTTLHTPASGHYYNGIQMTSQNATQEKAQLVVDKNDGGFWTRYCVNNTWNPWTRYETTTGSQAKADAAKQQSIDWVKSFGLGNNGTTRLGNGTNLNDVNFGGAYDVPSPKNAPAELSSDPFIKLIVVPTGDPAYRHQIALSMTNAGYKNRMFLRECQSGTYSAWREIAGKDDVDALKAVTQNSKITSDDGSVYHNFNTASFADGKNYMDALPKGLFTFRWDNITEVPVARGVILKEYTDWISIVGWDNDAIMYSLRKTSAGWGDWVKQENVYGSQAKADAAKQGAIDWAKSFGLGAIAKRVADGSDANNLVLSGWYDGRGLVNDPDNTQGEWKKYFVLNSGDATNQFVTQLAFTMTANNNLMWTRQLTNISGTPTWTPWKKIAGTDDINALKSITQNKKITADNGDYYLHVGSGDDAYAKLASLPSGIHSIFITQGAINYSPSLGSFKGIAINESGNYIYVFGITDKGKFIFNSNNGGWGSWVESWSAINQGDGSGLDADLLGGINHINFPTSTTGNLELYVSPNGNDSTGNGTQSNPFKTIQHALDSIPPIVNHNVIIHLADGQYFENVHVHKTGCGSISIQGTSRNNEDSGSGGTEIFGCIVADKCNTFIDVYKIKVVHNNVDVNVDGINVTGAVHIIGCVNAYINDCTLDGYMNYHGVVTDKSIVVVCNSTIRHTEDGILADLASNVLSLNNYTPSEDVNSNHFALVAVNGGKIGKHGNQPGGQNWEYAGDGGQIL